MDRFKFRVWREEEKRFVESDCGSPLVISQEGMLCDSYDYLDYDGFGIVEQCTGLKDKNGKLIYEGDIVRVLEQYKTNTTEQLYPMMFNKKVAKFGFKHPDGHFFYFTNNEDFSYEVIGNIHENPDLLGEE